MSGRNRQIIAIILIAALWMPAVILPSSASASSTVDSSGNPSSMASIFGLVWAKLASLTGSAAQDADDVAPPGMPAFERRQRDRTAPKPPRSKAGREAKVASLKLIPAGDVALQPGQQIVLAAIPQDHNGNAVQGLIAEWESNNPEVVSITTDGLATANQPGNAHLRVRAGHKQEKLDVTVRAAQANSGDGVQNSSSLDPPQSLRRAEEIKTINPTSRESRSNVSLSHTRNNGKLRAALSPQIIYEDNKYVSEVGSPPGRTEPGASTPPAAIAGTEKPGSANFSFQVPLLSLPGRGLDVALTLFYNSHLWSYKSSSMTKMYYNKDGGFPAPGFQLSYGKLLWRNNSEEVGFILVDPDGTRHKMVSVSGLSTDTEWNTTDGTFIHFSGSNTNGGTISYPNGTRALYVAGSLFAGPTRITDRNGNFIMISYDGSRMSSIQDTMGRHITFHYAGNDLVTITAPDYEGDENEVRQVVRFYYKNITVNPVAPGNSAFAVSSGGLGLPSNQPATVHVLNYVYFPGTKGGYRYDYSEPYGMIYRTTQLRRMTVSPDDPDSTGTVVADGQTAAWTEYNYPTVASNLTEVPKYTRRTDDWAGRTSGMNGNVLIAPYQSFSVTEGTGVSISTVTTPDGTVTETQSYNTFDSNNGLVKEITVRQGSTVLAKTSMQWEARDYNYDTDPPIPLDMRMKQVRVTNEAGQTKTIVYEYDYFNNVTKIRELGFDGANGTLGAELRRTETTYETRPEWTSRKLLRLPTTVKVFEGGSNIPSAWVKYDYDAVGGMDLTQRSDIVMLDPAYNPSVPGYSQATDKRGNLSSITAYADAATASQATVNTSSYDIAGNVVSQTVNCCRRKDIIYDGGYQYAYPTKVIRGDAGQLTTEAGYDFPTGLLRTQKDENLQTTTYYYFPDSLRLDYVQRPDASYTRWHYDEDKLFYAPDEAHLNSYVAVATSTAVDKVVWDYQFMDGRGAVTRHFKSNPDPVGFSSTDTEYDEMGRAKRTSNPYYSAGCISAINPSGLWTSVAHYDGLGRATQVQLPDNTSVQTGFTGKTTTVTDQAGRQRRQITDALGRIIRVDEPDQSGSLGTTDLPNQPTSYEYDALDNLTRVTQTEAGGVTQQRLFKYDSLGHLTHERQVEATATLNSDGVRVGTGGQWTGVYKYDSQGLRSDAFDARGVRTQIEYDGLNRIHRVSYTGETGTIRTPAVTYTYDEAHTGYFNKGRLTRVSTDAVTTPNVQAVPQTIQDYDYNLMGRVTSQQQTVGSSESYTLTYGYNMLGQLASEQYPSGRVVSYDYDDGGRLSQVRNGSTGNYVTSVTYKAHGGMETMTLGNGAVQSVSYNTRLQAEQLKLMVAGVERQRFDYQYGVVNLSTGDVDAAKNTGQVGRVEGYIDGARQWRQMYQYDAFGRLDIAAERRGDNLEQEAWSADYGYDRFGNRTQSGGENRNLSYFQVTASEIDKATNRLTSNITYDDAGNVSINNKFRNQQYGYDGNGRQVRVTQTITSGDSTAVYDGVGQRVQAVESGRVKTLVYDIFGQMVAEYGGQASSTSGTHYVMSDVQGSTRVVMNDSGVVEARHDYLPFGEEIPSDAQWRTTARGYGASDSTRHRYAGMERDAEGVDHTLWRKYESRAGRWTTPDPYGGSMRVSNPQSFNRYVYVNNDPVNFTDPMGLDEEGWQDFAFQGWVLTVLRSGGRGGGIPYIHQEKGSGNLNNLDSKEKNCGQFADIVDELAQSSDNDASFVGALRDRFVASDQEAHTGTGKYAEFKTGMGFKGAFKEPPNLSGGSPNQVHHYVGVFAGRTASDWGAYSAGVAARAAGRAMAPLNPTRDAYTYYPGRAAALTAADRHEHFPENPAASRMADTALNSFVVDHAFKLAYGLIDRKDLGNLIRNEICDK